MTQTFAKIHDAHRVAYDDAEDEGRSEIVATWGDDSFLATHLEKTMGYEVGAYFGRYGYTAVTIGDGRGGLDARRLMQRGAKDVLPTDICEFLLRKAQRDGDIQRYSVENAEALSFPDESFDFAFIKEALHHLPRPWIGLYEMLRVARKGVVLVEPNDQARTPYMWLKRLRKAVIPGEYESAGNFVYRVSGEELIRVAMGMDYPAIAFRHENFASAPGFDFIRTDERSFRALSFKAKRLIRRACATVGIIRPIMLLTIIFKEMPTDEQIAWLRAQGWNFRPLERNPIIHRLAVASHEEAPRSQAEGAPLAG